MESSKHRALTEKPSIRTTRTTERAYQNNAKSLCAVGYRIGAGEPYWTVFLAINVARIERAWRRPRSAVNADRAHLGSGQNNHASAPDDVFNCVVRIIQDAQGVVQEVQLIACNGTAEWRQSLMSAIFASSPLPAPPSPTVFTRTLMMTFRGHAYSAESDADDYAAETAYAARR